MDDPDDERLMRCIAAGDDGAFGVFYRRHLPAVTTFFVRRTRDRETAFDLTAETFAAVVVAAGRFDPRRGPAVAWLLGIADHKLRDSRRRARVEAGARRRLALEPIALTDDDLARIDEMGDGAADLVALVAALPAGQRHAVTARVLEEQPYVDIAAELQCSEAVVRQRVRRGLQRLRRTVGEEPAP